jgi:hypothetical protein
LLSGEVERLSSTEKKILDALRRRERYRKTLKDYPVRSAFLGAIGFGPHWNLETENYRLGPSIHELEELIWEKDLVHIRQSDAERPDEN